MDHEKHQGIIEALLFVTGDDGLSLKQICDVLEVDEAYAAQLIERLKEDYESAKHGLHIIEIANTYKITTKKQMGAYIEKLVEAPSSRTLSQAALETLAIIAYKQPITRVEIEEIRGVKSERPIQTLLARSLIQEVGRSEQTGRAILYGTTPEFLDSFGLKSIEELPPFPKHENEEMSEDADLFFEKFQETFPNLDE